MIRYYKFILTILICFSFAIHASAFNEYYPGQATGPLSNCVSFDDINRTQAQAELELSQCISTDQKLSILEYYEHAFSMLAEDGKGGVTQQGKYAEMLRAFYCDQRYDIYA